MTDIAGPRAFIGVQPCRVADTRGNGAPIQGGIFANSEARDWLVVGICGIPGGADAISVNFSVVSAPATPQGGFLLAWPTGSPPVQTTAIMTYGPGVTVLSNAAIVPLSSTGSLTVNVSHSTHVIMDVNGYFSDTLSNPANFLELHNNVAGAPTAFFHNSSAATNSSAVFGLVGAGIPRPAYAAAGVRGEGALTGVLGISHNLGVAGSLVNGAGAEVAFGIMGFQVADPEPEITGVKVGVFGQTNENFGGYAGVLGYASASTGQIYGVRGVTGSASIGAAGVRGTDGGGTVSTTLSAPSGVRGESVHWGVLGLTSSAGSCGVYGKREAGAGSSEGGLGCAGAGVFGTSVAAIGNTSFVEPHPSNASVMIRYISLQGNEAGTYFRGRGKFQNGLARIPVPEDFRVVTDPEGLTVQITPIGGMATVGVVKMGLDEVVAQASRDLEFSYLVQGVRHAYKDSGPIAEDGNLFAPRSPDEVMPANLPAALQQRLISNGTYRPDGKVNMETAQRLGWDKIWEERSRPRPQPVEP